MGRGGRLGIVLDWGRGDWGGAGRAGRGGGGGERGRLGGDVEGWGACWHDRRGARSHVMPKLSSTSTSMASCSAGHSHPLGGLRGANHTHASQQLRAWREGQGERVRVREGRRESEREKWRETWMRETRGRGRDTGSGASIRPLGRRFDSRLNLVLGDLERVELGLAASALPLGPLPPLLARLQPPLALGSPRHGLSPTRPSPLPPQFEKEKEFAAGVL